MSARSSRAKTARLAHKPFRPLQHEIPLLAALSTTFRPELTSAQRGNVITYIREYIAEYGPVPDRQGDYHAVVTDLAAELYGQDRIARDEAALERADRALITRGWNDEAASDLAVHRWTPVVEAAVLFGLAMGLALAHSGGGVR